MKKININKVLTACFLVCLCVFLIVVNVNKPRVLVLHSYQTDFSWVTDINESIDKVFEKKPYSIRYHYMDTKRHPELEYKEKAGLMAKNVIKSFKPNVIIAVDDNAQEFVCKYFINDPKINIVFTGLNGNPENYGYDQATNVTGVLERIPYDALKEVFLQVTSSDNKRVLHVSDASKTSRFIHEELIAFQWEPLKMIESIQCETFDDWKKVIKEYEGKVDFLLITHYHTIKRSSDETAVVPPKEILEWTMNNTKIPSIGCWGFNVEDGGMMAVAVSPYEQGEVAANMAVDIIENGTKPNKLPIVTNRLYVMYLRDSLLKRYSVKLPMMYEAFARAMNHYYK